MADVSRKLYLLLVAALVASLAAAFVLHRQDGEPAEVDEA